MYSLIQCYLSNTTATARYSFMRRNVRRLNREVGSLNASQAAAKRKGGTGTASKSAKKSKDAAVVYTNAGAAEEDEFHLPNLPLSSCTAFSSDGRCFIRSLKPVFPFSFSLSRYHFPFSFRRYQPNCSKHTSQYRCSKYIK